MNQEPLHVTDATFQKDVLESTLPVLVDFWAEWCPPCRALAPTIEELAKDYDGRVLVVKMDTVENVATPDKYDLKGIPTLILFKGGKEVERLVGVRPKKSIAEKLDALLAPAK